MLSLLRPIGALQKLIDFFIRQERYENPTDLYRARILVGSLLTVV